MHHLPLPKPCYPLLHAAYLSAALYTTQVLLWLADIQVLLNNLSGIDQYKAAAERIKSCLPTELSGVEDWAHLMAVLKMPVRIFYPSLSLAAVGGLEDLPGAGAEEVGVSFFHSIAEAFPDPAS